MCRCAVWQQRSARAAAVKARGRAPVARRRSCASLHVAARSRALGIALGIALAEHCTTTLPTPPVITRSG